MNKLLMLIPLFFVAQVCSAGECVELPKIAGSFIKTFNAKLRGVADCNARLIARGDVDSDGIEDVIVAFTIEGACWKDKSAAAGSCGNHDETYLKVFFGKTSKEIPVLQIASRGVRQITGLRFSDGTIHAETLKYGKDDPECCPTIKGKTRFVLHKDAIAEQRP